MVTYTFTNGTTADADEVNQNFKDVQKNIPQIPLTTLKSTGTWTNEGNLAADRTTDSNGANNTINTGSSTALFETDKYILSIDDEASSGTTHNPDGLSSPENFFDNNDSTSSSFNCTNCQDVSKSLGKTFSAKTLQSAYIKASGSTNTDGSSATLKLQTYDGSTWSDFQTLDTDSGSASSLSVSFTGGVDLSSAGSIQGLRINIFIDTVSSPSNSITIDFFTLEYGNYNLSSSIIVDTGTLTLSGSEESTVIYSSSSIPTNTSIKVTLNDGTKDISAQTTLSENDGTVIPLTATPVTDSTLELHYSLETTDTSVTPEWYGYGVSKV